MRVIYFIFCISLFIQSCIIVNSNEFIFSKNNTSNIHFQLIQANLQHTTGGQPGNNYTNYSVYLVVLKDNCSLIFDSAWSKSNAFEIIVSKERNTNNLRQGLFLRGDTILLNVMIHQQKVKDPIFRPPMNFQGEILFRYFICQQPFYFSVQKFNLLESIQYQ